MTRLYWHSTSFVEVPAELNIGDHALDNTKDLFIHTGHGDTGQTHLFKFRLRPKSQFGNSDSGMIIGASSG
jgi:hypothetical protein